MKVSGIVTLYYPDKNVKKNILSYLNELDKLYVIDNTPNQTNENILPINSKIYYLPQKKNIGVAAALNLGAKNAIKDGYDWLLTMDQDSCFEKDSIKQMKDFLENTKEKKIGLITPWHVVNTGVKKPKDKIDYPLEVMTSGNIISLKAYSSVGGYKNWFFIDDIDIEYCMNLHVHGYKVIRLNYINLQHDLGNIEVKHLFNRDFVCSNHNYIRRYYMVRNTFYLCDMYKTKFPDYCRFLKRGLRGQLQNILLFEKDKVRKICNMYRGYRDYKKNIKGEFPYKIK